jgi:hypothetical protein
MVRWKGQAPSGHPGIRNPREPVACCNRCLCRARKSAKGSDVTTDGGFDVTIRAQTPRIAHRLDRRDGPAGRQLNDGGPSS